ANSHNREGAYDLCECGRASEECNPQGKKKCATAHHPIEMRVYRDKTNSGKYRQKFHVYFCRTSHKPHENRHLPTGYSKEYRISKYLHGSLNDLRRQDQKSKRHDCRRWSKLAQYYRCQPRHARNHKRRMKKPKANLRGPAKVQPQPVEQVAEWRHAISWNA